MKFVRISEEFELSEFELTGVNYYKMYCQIQGELELVRVSEEFELSEFELAGFYCTYLFVFYSCSLVHHQQLSKIIKVSNLV